MHTTSTSLICRRNLIKMRFDIVSRLIRVPDASSLFTQRLTSEQAIVTPNMMSPNSTTCPKGWMKVTLFSKLENSFQIFKITEIMLCTTTISNSTWKRAGNVEKFTVYWKLSNPSGKKLILISILQWDRLWHHPMRKIYLNSWIIPSIEKWCKTITGTPVSTSSPVQDAWILHDPLSKILISSMTMSLSSTSQNQTYSSTSQSTFESIYSTSQSFRCIVLTIVRVCHRTIIYGHGQLMLSHSNPRCLRRHAKASERVWHLRLLQQPFSFHQDKCKGDRLIQTKSRGRRIYWSPEKDACIVCYIAQHKTEENAHKEVTR